MTLILATASGNPNRNKSIISSPIVSLISTNHPLVATSSSVEEKTRETLGAGGIHPDAERVFLPPPGLQSSRVRQILAHVISLIG